MMKVQQYYCVCKHTVIDFWHLVLNVQFASTAFSGLESSGEIIVTVIIRGGTPNINTSLIVAFSEATATG